MRNRMPKPTQDRKSFRLRDFRKSFAWWNHHKGNARQFLKRRLERMGE